VNLNSPHLPYRPDPLALDAVVSRGHSVERTRRLAFVAGEWEHMAGAYALDAVDFEVLRDLYQGEIRGVDAFVGRLVDTLSASGVLDRTVVVVTSDHGENLGERGRIGHVLCMDDTTLRVPLVARYPARIAPGTVVDDLASGVDVAPTILDAAGLEAPPSSGRSLLDAARPTPAFVVAENDRPLNGIRLLRSKFPDFDTRGVDGRMRMLRSDRYKLIWHEVHGVELYDLESDPEELDDMSDSRPELREALLGQLEPWLEPGPERGDEPVDPLDLDPEAREQLRALGYVH
jgi:arylsulfatase A-like enzyme